jgi:hypothetical protein
MPIADPKFKIEQPAGEQGGPYLPPGPPEPLLFEEFEGINTATTRPGVDDKQAYWLDSFMPLSRRNLRTMWGVGTPLFTPADSDTIQFFDFFNIGATPYALVIVGSGQIYAVNTSTGAVTSIAADGTITNPVRAAVGLTQWGSQYVIIVANQTNGYWMWDGTTFYTAGGAAPGGGTLPTGIQGTAVQTYEGRVWIANGATITFSSPGSFKDFASGDGGGNFTSSDSFLRVGYTGLIQTNGFLYLIGDSSVNYISGVQTSGTPPVTTFTNNNADPEVGTPWPGTLDVFGRNILFANAFGAHVSYGAAVTKISEPLDGIYNTVPNFGSIQPSAAKAIIFGKKVWMLLLPIIDPISGQQVNKLLMWNGKIWWAASQNIPLLFVQHQEINSVITAYGTDGKSIYQLFSTPSTAFTKIAQTKLWDKPGDYRFNKTPNRFWSILQYYNPASPNLTISIDNEINSDSNDYTVTSPIEMDWVTASGAAMNWTTAGGQPMLWQAAGIGFGVTGPLAVGQQGVLTGFTASTNCADMAIISAMIHDELFQYRG